ncbi:MAG: MOSC domain-containing protein [Sphingomonadales bacterium]|nr:MAG: MOSC domain-containing protein [Sphingomonadales bacterium]TNF03571.1 MAG: MOSC domain-containing protein [Sphingomonadales bacterium]
MPGYGRKGIRMHISAIIVYPVKSLGGVALPSAGLEPRGLAGDRRWMIVDETGRFVTRRECPALARIAVAMDGDDGFRLDAGTQGSARLPRLAEGEPSSEVRVWRDRVPAIVVDNEASALISDVAGRALRLAYMPVEALRPVDPAYGAAGDHVSFADGFPVLMTSEASLDALNIALEQPVPMERFRPNLVVSREEGPEPWAEGGWRHARVGAIGFDLVKPCSRCVVITQDHLTGEQTDGNAPLKALRKLGRVGKDGVLFGQNAIPRQAGRITVGDPVIVER